MISDALTLDMRRSPVTTGIPRRPLGLLLYQDRAPRGALLSSYWMDSRSDTLVRIPGLPR